MIRCLFISLILLSSVETFSQNYRELVDARVACSYGSPNNSIDPNTKQPKIADYFFIVEQMPRSKIPVKKIEQLLNHQVEFIKEEAKITDRIVFQTLISCQGKAGDFLFLHCPLELKNVCGRVIDIFMNEVTDWEPGVQNSVPVDVLMRIEILVDSGNFQIKQFE